MKITADLPLADRLKGVRKSLLKIRYEGTKNVVDSLSDELEQIENELRKQAVAET